MLTLQDGRSALITPNKERANEPSALPLLLAMALRSSACSGSSLLLSLFSSAPPPRRKDERRKEEFSCLFSLLIGFHSLRSLLPSTKGKRKDIPLGRLVFFFAEHYGGEPPITHHKEKPNGPTPFPLILQYHLFISSLNFFSLFNQKEMEMKEKKRHSVKLVCCCLSFLCGAVRQRLPPLTHKENKQPNFTSFPPMPHPPSILFFFTSSPIRKSELREKKELNGVRPILPGSTKFINNLSFCSFINSFTKIKLLSKLSLTR